MRLDGASYPKPVVDESSVFFNSGEVPRLTITLGKAEFDSLVKEPRKYVRCTVTDSETNVYRDVGVKLKAGIGSFRPVTDRPAMTLNFDKYNKHQRFHGLDKLNLNNSVQDSTLCHELLGSLLFRAAGLPVARVAHARVELNGKMLGVYVLMEGLDTGFLRLNFGNGFGTLYDGSFHEITDDNIPKRASSKNNKSDDIKALKTALEEKDPVKRRQRLELVLDVDRFLSFMALEAMACHWDGYCNAKNNYRVYHDPTTDKLVFIAHGMDQIFGDPNYGLQQGNGWVARALTETPEDKRQYFLRVQQLRQSVCKEEMLTNTVLRVAARLKPVFEEFDPNAARGHADAVADLCRRIAARGVNIDRQLGTLLGLPWEPKPPKDWQTRISEGIPSFDQFKDGDKSRLRIRVAKNQTVVGSWRTRVILPQGRYIFDGRVRTVDVPESKDPSQGAALRISGGQRRASITGSTDWRKLEYEINADQGVTDLELVCELRASRGEAWFDTDSLRIVRKEGNK